MKIALTLLIVGLFIGCGSDGKDPANGSMVTNNDRMSGPDVGSFNSETGDAGVVDSGDGVSPMPDMRPEVDPTPCTEIADFESTLLLDRDGESGQLYGEAAFDGLGVWVAYNRPRSADGSGGSNEGIFVSRLTCDGSIDFGPWELSDPEEDARNYYPTIQAYEDRIMVAWVSDPTDGSAKRVLYAGFDRNGNRLNSTNSDITPTVGDLDPVSETIWELDLAAYDGGAVVVASALGVDERIVAQRFTFEGDRDGDAFFPYENKGIRQSLPSVSADADGTLYIAWRRFVPADSETGDPEVPNRAVMITIAAGANGPGDETPIPARTLASENETLRFGQSPSSDGEHWLAFQSFESDRSDIRVRDASETTNQSAVLGTMGWVNFRPSVAAGDTMNAVAYARYQQSPIRTDVVVQSFAQNGASFDIGEPMVLVNDETGKSPYGPRVLHVGQDAFFVVWSQGDTAAEARLRGRFLRVLPPN